MDIRLINSRIIGISMIYTTRWHEREFSAHFDIDQTYNKIAASLISLIEIIVPI